MVRWHFKGKIVEKKEINVAQLGLTEDHTLYPVILVELRMMNIEKEATIKIDIGDSSSLGALSDPYQIGDHLSIDAHVLPLLMSIDKESVLIQSVHNVQKRKDNPDLFDFMNKSHKDLS